MTTITSDTTDQTVLTAELERLTAESEQHTTRHDELTAELRTTVVALEQARADLGDAIAAGADATAIHERIRELQTTADGYERAIATVAARKQDLAGPILTTRRRIAAAEAEEARLVFLRTENELATAVNESVTRVRELYGRMHSAGHAANAAAVQSDQLIGRQVTIQTAQQVYGGRARSIPMAHLLEAVEGYVNENHNDALFAQVREYQRQDQLRARATATPAAGAVPARVATERPFDGRA